MESMDGECKPASDEAELIITDWLMEFLDHDRPEHPLIGPASLLKRLRDRGWHLVRCEPGRHEGV